MNSLCSKQKDENKIIKIGNERVVDARLSDASFFWRETNFKFNEQINKLKKLRFMKT